MFVFAVKNTTDVMFNRTRHFARVEKWDRCGKKTLFAPYFLQNTPCLSFVNQQLKHIQAVLVNNKGHGMSG